MTTSMRVWSGCMRPGARPRKPRKALPRSPKSARRIGGAARSDFPDYSSATPADTAQAFVNLVVFLSHLPQRIQRRRVDGWLGLAPRGELGFLSLVTGL